VFSIHFVLLVKALVAFYRGSGRGAGGGVCWSGCEKGTTMQRIRCQDRVWYEALTYDMCVLCT
jgi:hypothetical protein